MPSTSAGVQARAVDARAEQRQHAVDVDEQERALSARGIEDRARDLLRVVPHRHVAAAVQA